MHPPEKIIGTWRLFSGEEVVAKMPTPSIEQQLAGYMFIVNPIVCPKCFLRYPRGTDVCRICGTKLPKD